MSKIMNERIDRHHRHKLLATVSAVALLGLVYTAAKADAADGDADRPLIWIELGGQLDRIEGKEQAYVPPFALVGIGNGLFSPASLETPPRYSIGEDGSISFQPESSDWVFSASIRYGRSASDKHRHQQTLLPVSACQPPPSFTGRCRYLVGPGNQPIARTADYAADLGERHEILDFQVGKDVGLGMFGHGGTSILSGGVRFAQFSTKNSMALLADPNPHFGDYKYIFGQRPSLQQYYQLYKARPVFQHNFRGVGPSLSWNGSTPMFSIGSRDTEITFDWGASLGLLFGRQRARIHHQTTGERNNVGFVEKYHHRYQNVSNVDRSRSIAVPNAGGSVGISLKFPNAKVSLGYRADMFFGAMDGGIDVRKSENRGFYGPFASISVGMGD